MDVAGIEAGRDFRKVIDESVATCGVLLALIGPGWLDEKNGSMRRMKKANDASMIPATLSEWKPPQP